MSPARRYLLDSRSFANWFARLGSRVSRCCLLGFRVRCLCNLQSAAVTHILKHSWRVFQGVEDYRGWMEALDLFRGKWAVPLRSWGACWEVAMPRTDLSRSQSRNEKIKKAMRDDKCRMCISRVELWIAWTCRKWPILWIRKLAAIKLSPQHRSSCLARKRWNCKEYLPTYFFESRIMNNV